MSSALLPQVGNEAESVKRAQRKPNPAQIVTWKQRPTERPSQKPTQKSGERKYYVDTHTSLNAIPTATVPTTAITYTAGAGIFSFFYILVLRTCSSRKPNSIRILMFSLELSLKARSNWIPEASASPVVEKKTFERNNSQRIELNVDQLWTPQLRKPFVSFVWPKLYKIFGQLACTK